MRFSWTHSGPGKGTYYVPGAMLDGTGTQTTKDRNSTPEEFTDWQERQQVTTAAFMHELL